MADAHEASRSPLVIDIARLGRRPGSMMTFNETVPAPGAHRPGPGRRSPEGAPLRTRPAARVGVRGRAGHRNGVGADDGGVRALPEPDHRERRDRPHRAVRLPRQRDRGDHRRRRGRARRQRLRRPRAADHRRGRPGAAVLAGVRPGLPGTVPGVRHPAGDGRAGPSVTRRSTRAGRSSSTNCASRPETTRDG